MVRTEGATVCVLTTNPVSVSRRVRGRRSAGMLGMGAWWNRLKERKGLPISPSHTPQQRLQLCVSRKTGIVCLELHSQSVKLSSEALQVDFRAVSLSSALGKSASLQKQLVLTGHQRFTHHSGSSSAQPSTPSCSFPNQHRRL